MLTLVSLYLSHGAGLGPRANLPIFGHHPPRDPKGFRNNIYRSLQCTPLPPSHPPFRQGKSYDSTGRVTVPALVALNEERCVIAKRVGKDRAWNDPPYPSAAM
jgi:hypothetical protein